MDGKRAAGERAAEFVRDGQVLGLGTGSTVQFTLERLRQRMDDEGLRVRGVPTSVQTEKECRRLGIELSDLDRDPRLDVTIDGADEVDPQRCLIKGGGGALTREKIVATASAEMIVVVGRNKLVERLGVDFLLPVEVLPFGLAPVLEALRALGCEAFVRQTAAGEPYVSDNGNAIVDCRVAGGIEDPVSLEAEIDKIPGILESGLFCGIAGRVVIGEDDGSTSVI